MKHINIKTIRTDGSTQSRVEINNEVVAEYAAAIKSGAEFPAVVVFNDGADNWLADGFHRFHAHNHAGKTSISADVRQGTSRDAVLYSLGANGTHGLNRTNADKRKAVMTMLNDVEWAKWSDSAIAKACAVHHSTVGDIRKSLAESASEKSTERTYTTKQGTTATMRTDGIGKAKKAIDAVPAPIQPAPVSAPQPSVATDVKEYPVTEVEDDAPDEAELRANALAAQADADYLQSLLDADDKLSAIHTENKRLHAEVAQLKVSRDGYMAELSWFKQNSVKLQRENDRLKKSK